AWASRFAGFTSSLGLLRAPLLCSIHMFFDGGSFGISHGGASNLRQSQQSVLVSSSVSSGLGAKNTFYSHLGCPHSYRSGHCAWQRVQMQMQWRATAAMLAAVFAQTDISLAAGAIAIGHPPDVAKRGISMGFSTNRDTMDDAKARSMI